MGWAQVTQYNIQQHQLNKSVQIWHFQIQYRKQNDTDTATGTRINESTSVNTFKPAGLWWIAVQVWDWRTQVSVYSMMHLRRKLATYLSTGLTGIFLSRSFPPFSNTKWLRFVLLFSAAPSAPINLRWGSERSEYGSSFYKIIVTLSLDCDLIHGSIIPLFAIYFVHHWYQHWGNRPCSPLLRTQSKYLWIHTPVGYNQLKNCVSWVRLGQDINFDWT